MGAYTNSADRADRTRQLLGSRIYYFYPLLAGPPRSWPAHLSRCKELGFSHLLSAPLFDPGESGDLLLASDHEIVNPAIEPAAAVDLFVTEFSRTCQHYGLSLLLDLVVGRIAANAVVANSKPDWFRRDIAGPRFDPQDARRHGDAAFARFDDSNIAKQIAAWWIERLTRLARAGAAGFRCEDPGSLPANLWRDVIACVKQAAPHCRFLAWTPGLAWPVISALRDVGFDAAFSSVAWWDGRANWLVEEHELLRDFGAVIGCPEVPYGPRLISRLQNPSAYRHSLRRAAAISDGIMIPMGLEFGEIATIDRPGSADDSRRDGKARKVKLVSEVAEAIALTNTLAAAGFTGAMRILTTPDQDVIALLRSDTADIRSAAHCVAVLLNNDFEHHQSLPIALDPLPPSAGIAALAEGPLSSDRDWRAALAPGEIRLLTIRPSAPITLRRSPAASSAPTTQPRIVIDNIAPTVDRGRFAAKSIVGDIIAIQADVFTDGHDLLAVDLAWRAADAAKWRRMPMQPIGNDRWQATIRPDRIGRHEFSIEAGWDRYGTFCRDLVVKRNAGADVSIEIAEGRQILEQSGAGKKNSMGEIIESALVRLAQSNSDECAEIFLADDLRQAMRAAERTLFRVREERVLPIEVERPQAVFGAWYELFPRSATDDPDRHGTFRDVIRHLPRIKEMGFDVLYLPPIHPIGSTNRKGKNNSLAVQPDDVGSPYAIGGAEGGHDAIHPALGTIHDFRLLRQACASQGIEIALDFAIQCSPDHPWLKQHPEWFKWRPDGSVQYAENPPKKYEDIVNVDFYTRHTFPLWEALRDLVLYWRGEDVRIFRVDNPHTKPLPFWEWLIAEVRSKYPDVIFLSEAFTRPKMMYRLAKVGFSQSYTYFTWRNTKHELTDYFSELTSSAVKDYFRPHLFVNTPDINPYFLQTSGRPGFLIRAALAATLSGLWGVYSGFELCEAAPLPGREEYMDSEKYQIRVRCYDAPGNIAPEIAKLNRIRRAHPALQTHLGLRFYPAHDDQVLLYGKRLPNQAEMILVAVSLDPFHARDVTIEVPVWEWQRPDHAQMKVTDLMRNMVFTWHGKLQRLRLDPAELPFAIWRITPSAGG